MFHQLLTPVGDSLAMSFLVAILPIATVLVLLGILKRPAWQAALAGLVVGLLIAATVWGMPARMAFASALNGAVFALWPVMWIVINALLLYNVAVASGRFDAFRAWVIRHLPNDRRVVLIAIGVCFAAHHVWLSGSRCAGVRADLQHDPRGVRRPRRARHGLGCGDGTAGAGAG